MAISSKIEEVVYEVSKIAGEVYDTLSNSLGSVDTPSSAIFEINNLLNLANSEAPYFSVLETTPAGFQITYDSNNPYYVNVSSGQVVYNGNIINIAPQELSIRKSFSQLYSNLYVYGMVVGLPIDEVQKATQAWFTETTTTASIGSTLIYISDSSVPESLGFPLEAQVGRFYLRFTGFNDDKTALLIDPGQNLGTIASPVYGQLQSSITSGSSIRFNYQPRLQTIAGFPVLTGDGTAMPEDFGYYPPLPLSWLPIGKFLVNNPGDQSIVVNSGEDAILSTVVALPLNNDSNPIFGDSEDNDRVISACENALSDLTQLKSSNIVSDVVQGLKSLSLKLDTTGQTSLRKIWSSQPFRAKSNFSKGLSFTGLERFEFSYPFCQAYYELTNEDLQHTFAIFRGDLVSNNSRLIGSTGIGNTYSATSLSSPGSLSSLERGTHIYGTSVVKSITGTTAGETVPKYIDITTNTVSNNNYLIELNWATVADGLFYHVYKRGNFASDLMEYRLTVPDEIQNQPKFDNTPVTDDSNVSMSLSYTAIKIEPENDGFCGGISLKHLFGPENYTVKNTNAYISATLYDSIADTVTSAETDATLDDTDTLYVPNIAAPLTNEVKLYFGDLTDQSDEYTFKFKKGVNLISGHIYWLILYRSANITVIDPETLAESSGTVYLRGEDRSGVGTYGEIKLWKSNTLTTGFENWTTYDSGGDENIYNPYYKLRGYLDNGLAVKYPVRRGLKFTNRIALTPRRISIYVPPVENINTAVSEYFSAAYDGLDSEDTTTKNEMIVTVTARNGALGTPITFTQTIPQYTVRDTRFTLGTTADLFDRIDDVTVTPGTNLQRTNNGPIKWSLYDFFTVETLP